MKLLDKIKILLGVIRAALNKGHDKGWWPEQGRGPNFPKDTK